MNKELMLIISSFRGVAEKYETKGCSLHIWTESTDSCWGVNCDNCIIFQRRHRHYYQEQIIQIFSQLNK